MATEHESSQLNWDKGHAVGNNEVLLIVPSFYDQSPEIVPRRPRGELSEDEQRKLEYQRVPRESHHDDLSIIKASFDLDKEMSISDIMTGDALTCEQVTKKITMLMNRTKATGGNLSLCACTFKLITLPYSDPLLYWSW